MLLRLKICSSRESDIERAAAHAGCDASSHFLSVRPCVVTWWRPPYRLFARIQLISPIDCTSRPRLPSLRWLSSVSLTQPRTPVRDKLPGFRVHISPTCAPGHPVRSPGHRLPTMDYLSWSAKHILGDSAGSGAGPGTSTATGGPQPGGHRPRVNVPLLIDRLRNSSIVGRHDLVAEIKVRRLHGVRQCEVVLWVLSRRIDGWLLWSCLFVACCWIHPQAVAITHQEELGKIGIPVLLSLLQQSDLRDNEVCRSGPVSMSCFVTYCDLGALHRSAKASSRRSSIL